MLLSGPKQIRRFGLRLLLLVLSGCAPYFHQPFREEPARLGAEVNTNTVLRSLPAAKERIVVAVYKFRDQTGQYKPMENGSSFSTAITQGATSILLRALEESRWFNPIERENLGNLLNERKIIRSTRAEYTQLTGKPEPPLPSLLFAGVILEGGIISYDANMVTGGAGLRYFGAGASGQYRQDRVTVYLRAISTSTGEILKTVYTTKTILSQQVDASLFRFVKYQRLLETETGFTYNEPSEMAVKDAIEKSVQGLVYEGIRDGLWSPREANEQAGPGITAYYKEKEENQSVDVLGRDLRDDRRGRFGIGVSGGATRYSGDLSQPRFGALGALTLGYDFGDAYRWAVGLNAGRFQLRAGDFYREAFNHADLRLQYRLFPKERFTPYVLAGGGLTQRVSPAGEAALLGHALAGIGAEVLVTNWFGLHVGADTHYYLSDRLDRVAQGRYNDFFWSMQAGTTFYLGKPPTKTTPVPR